MTCIDSCLPGSLSAVVAVIRRFGVIGGEISAYNSLIWASHALDAKIIGSG
jgi:hypothetical protein